MNKTVVSVKIEHLLGNGRKEISSKKQLEKYPIGSLISYMNIDDVFRAGGYITDYKNDYFVYITPDFTTKYRGRYSHVAKMWVGTVYTTQNDVVSITRTSKKKTNFPVIVNGAIIYYGSNAFDVKRYQYTEKYKRIIQWCEYFESESNNT